MKKNSRKWVSGLLCLLLITGNLAFAEPHATYSAVETEGAESSEQGLSNGSYPENYKALDKEGQVQDADLVDEESDYQITDGEIDKNFEIPEEQEDELEEIIDGTQDISGENLAEISGVVDKTGDGDEEPLEADVEGSVGEHNLISHEPLDLELDLEDTATGVRASETDVSYDANRHGLVTDVKNQGGYGTCWAFTTSSLAETSLIKNKVSVGGTTATKANTDLSELHVAYFFYNRPADPLGNTTGDKVIISSKHNYATIGGNTYLQAFSYANGIGAVSESVLRYERIGAISTATAGKAYQHPAAIKNAYFINNTKTEIKKAIIEYGSVGISYYHDEYNEELYYNDSTYAYSFPNWTTRVNHAVTVVGWDDKFSKSKFTPTSREGITKDGAWIVKNSWGKDWGDGGYYYISYEDSSIYEAIAMEFQDGSQYDYNYQYDGTPGIAYGSVGSGGKIANVYQVKGSNKNGNEILKAVNFALNSTDINYSIQVYVDIQDRNNPTSGTAALKAPMTGVTSYSGIYTVDLDADIALSKGTYYSIVITLNGKKTINYFVETSYNGGWMYSQANTAAKQSFASWSGTSWVDLGTFGENSYCARIKGLTVEDPVTPLPSTLQKASSGSYNSNKLTWTRTAGAAGYEIYRSTSSGSGFTKIATISNGSTVTYTDKGLSFNKTYYYKIRSYKNSTGGQVTLKVKGYYSKVLSSKTTLSKPTVSKVASAGYNKIKVTWGKISGAQGYQLVRSTSKTGTYTTVAKITAGSTISYTDKGRTTGKKYYYKVRPYRKVGKTNVYGSYSAVLDGTANLSKSSITGLNNSTAGKMKLTWKQISGASGYEVYRKTGASGTYKNVKTIKGASTLTYTNANLQSGTYYYKVRAYRMVSGKKVYGAFSVVKNAKLKEIPAKKVVLNKSSEKATLMPTAIVLSENTMQLSKGATGELSTAISSYKKNQIQLTATVTPSNTTMKKVAWTTSNKAVASVSSKGLVTLVKPGTATITAKTINGLTKTFKLTINAGSITWKSSDTSIATVSQGKVTAVAPGTTVIIVQVANGASADCTVTVVP